LTPPAHRSGSAQLGKDKPIPYLRTWYFSDDIPDLVEDFTPPPLFHSSDAFLRLPEDLRPPFRWLFFGPAGTESKLHVDIWETDAWLGMLQGEKTFTLYHPAHRKFLEVGDNVWPDLLKGHNPDKFPQQSMAVPAQTLLKAGEIIYIPRKWPHHAVAQVACFCSVPYTLHPIPYTLSYTRYPMPCTLYPTPCALYSIPCILYPIPVTLHPIPYIPYPIPYTLYPIPYSLYPIPYTLYPIPVTLHTIPYTLYPIPVTLHPIPFLYPGV